MESTRSLVAAPGDGLAVRARSSAVLSAGVVAVMWVLELLDTITGHLFDHLGALRAWQPGDLWAVFTAPWLHLGWGHLASNSVPLLVLGFLVALDGLRRWLATTAVVAMCSGAAAWLLSIPGTATLGASGIVFGWLGFLVARCWWSRDWRQLLVALVVLVGYGSILWGVLPTTPGVSWQAHLGGALGGVLAAWLAHRPGRRATA